ncbi:MAG: ABC transporter permease [Acidimicrobiia bacterium]|nr:MAG: ABC transporter permease [Acidimicrobiia bacterium]
MKKVLAIGWVNIVRFMRERANLFFVFAFPLLLILLLGAMYGGGFDTKVGVLVEGPGGPLADRLVAAVEDLDETTVVAYDSEPSLIDAVQRGRADGGLVIPSGYDAALVEGGRAEVTFIGRPADQTAQLLQVSVSEVLAAELAPVRAARFAEVETGDSFDALLARARVVVPQSERVSVSYREAGEPIFEGIEELGAFDLGASQQLVLFMFLTSLAGSAALIQSRRLGVTRRMLSTPSSTLVIVGGEATGRFAVAIIQGVYIMVGTLLIFGVNWGSPLGAIAVLIMFSLVGAGAAMLMGALFHNDQQAGGLGVLIALGLGALGGSMVPIEIFPDNIQTVAKFTPHSWAIDAFAELVRRDGSIVDILPQLGVLAAFAAVMLLLATWRLQRVLTR